MEVQVGDIVFSGPKNAGFYSKSVMFFTKSRWSHCFFIMTDVANERAVLEADLKCQVVPWNSEYIINDNDYYEVYRLKKAAPEELAKAANEVYLEYAGEEYGFLQIPWFMWDAACRKIGFNSGANWFPSGSICSEVLAAFLIKINLMYTLAFSNYRDLNRVSPEMLYDVVKNQPELFEKVGEKI